MGDMRSGHYLRAPTKKELEQKAREWLRDRREAGFEDVRWGWDPAEAVKADDGMWEIELWVHS